MQYSVDENRTRHAIIVLLKKSGGMTIEELRRVIKITPMGIRQHLLALEKKGIVTYVAQRRGIGRPGFLYMLTDQAEGLFPTSYESLAVGALRDIREHFGGEAIDEIFRRRKDRLVRDRMDELKQSGSLEETLQGLVSFLNGDGYLAEVGRDNGHYRLSQYHCPIGAVAREFGEACKYELFLYKELLGDKVYRTQSIADGAAHCLYIIPADRPSDA